MDGPQGPRPRILIVNWRDPRNPQAGGAEVHLHEVTRRLAADGFPCVLYAHAFPGAPAEEWIDGVRVLRRGGAMTFNFTVWRNLRRWCAEHRPDVVIDDSNKIVFLLPWLSPAPVVARFHHLFGRAIFRETNPLAALYVALFEGLIRFAYRGVPVITVSPSTRAELRAKGLRDVAIAPNGVDRTRYRVLPGIERDPALLFHVGRLKRYKKVDVLIRALALVRREIPDARLVIAGSGDDRSALESLARALGLGDAISFRGFVTEEEKVRLYNQAAVFVNASLKEGWGLTSVEANACGTPAVASDAPGLRDSVRDGVTGRLARPGDPASFAAAILGILRDATVAERLRTGALAWAAEHDWTRAYEATRAVLLRAAGGSRG